MSIIQTLIVEDERLYGDLLCEYLEALGHDVLGPVASAAEGLALFAALRPDLVLLDIGLRGPLDGVELAGQLLRQRPVPLIFITAFADRTTFERARAVGPAAFITKPFEAATVRNAVELALFNFASAAATPAPAAPPLPWAQDMLLGEAFFLKDKAGLTKIPCPEVLYVEAGDKYCVLMRANGSRHTLRMSLREVAETLAAHGFVQVHRSFVINARHLEAVDPVGFTLRVGRHTLPLGRSYKDDLLRRLTLLGEGT